MSSLCAFVCVSLLWMRMFPVCGNGCLQREKIKGSDSYQSSSHGSVLFALSKWTSPYKQQAVTQDQHSAPKQTHVGRCVETHTSFRDTEQAVGSTENMCRADEEDSQAKQNQTNTIYHPVHSKTRDNFRQCCQHCLGAGRVLVSERFTLFPLWSGVWKIVAADSIKGWMNRAGILISDCLS